MSPQSTRFYLPSAIRAFKKAVRSKTLNAGSRSSSAAVSGSLPTYVTVCGGVTIGDNTVIAAGAVVTKDIPSGVLAGAVPCRAVRPLTEKDRLGVYDD